MKTLNLKQIDKKYFEDKLLKIRNLTDINHHVMALFHVADLIGDDKYKKIFQFIEDLICIEGHLPERVYLHQRRFAKEMFEKIEVEYGKGVLNKIRQAL